MSTAPKCVSERVRTHKRLVRCLETVPSVRSAAFVPAEDASAGQPETVVTVVANCRATIPNSVLLKVLASGLAIGPVDTDTGPRLARVVVR